jgi:hypothetical protein
MSIPENDCGTVRREDTVERPRRGGRRAEHVHDGATFTHLAGRTPVDEEHGARVRPIHLVEVIESGRHHGGRDLAAHRMHDRVYRTERLDRLREESLDVQLVGNVSADGNGCTASLGHRINGCLGRLLIMEIVDRHRVPEARQPLDCHSANASRPAGHDDDPARVEPSDSSITLRTVLRLTALRARNHYWFWSSRR